MGRKGIGRPGLKLEAFIDGSSIGNPGEAGYGFVLKTHKGEILARIGRRIGRATNNTAEYRGLLGCLDMAAAYEARSLLVHSDSELLVNQMNGSYRVKQAHLQELHQQAMQIIQREFPDFQIRHIPRTMNGEADGLAKKAIRLSTDIEEISVSPRRQNG